MDLAGGDQHRQRVGAAVRFQRPTQQPVRLSGRLEGGYDLGVGAGAGQLMAGVQLVGAGEPAATRLPPLDAVQGHAEQLGEGFLGEAGGAPGKLEDLTGDHPGRPAGGGEGCRHAWAFPTPTRTRSTAVEASLRLTRPSPPPDPYWQSVAEQVFQRKPWGQRSGKGAGPDS